MAISLSEVLNANAVSVLKYPIAEYEGGDQRKILIIACADGAIPPQTVFGELLDRNKIDVERNAGAVLTDETIGRILFLVEQHPTELILYMTHPGWCGAENYANSPAGEFSTLARQVRARTENYLELKAEVERLYSRKLKDQGREPIAVEWVELREDGTLVPHLV